MLRKLILFCVSFLGGGWLCSAQVVNFGDAAIWVHNLGEHVGEEWPIFLYNGRTNQLEHFK
jgi:hypothetical protein